MSTNIGTVDRLLRAVLGVVLLYLAFASGLPTFEADVPKYVAGAVGVVMLLNAPQRRAGGRAFLLASGAIMAGYLPWITSMVRSTAVSWSPVGERTVVREPSATRSLSASASEWRVA